MAAPDTAFVCTLFLQDKNGRLGWTETYFRDDATYAAAQTFVDDLVAARALCLCDNYKIRSSRISLSNIPGDRQNFKYDTSGSIDATANKPSDPWTALLLQMSASPSRWGRRFLHGIPQNVFAADGSFDALSAFGAQFLAYALLLQGGNNLIKITDSVGPPRVFKYYATVNVYNDRQTEHRIGRPFGLLVGRR